MPISHRSPLVTVEFRDAAKHILNRVPAEFAAVVYDLLLVPVANAGKLPSAKAVKIYVEIPFSAPLEIGHRTEGFPRRDFS